MPHNLFSLLDVLASLLLLRTSSIEATYNAEYEIIFVQFSSSFCSSHFFFRVYLFCSFAASSTEMDEMIESHTLTQNSSGKKKVVWNKNVIQQLIWTPFGSRHKLAPSNIQRSSSINNCWIFFFFELGEMIVDFEGLWRICKVLRYN